MNDNNSEWKRMSFKGNKVWVPVNENNELVIENNKILIKYNLKQNYEYRVKPEDLKSAEAVNLVKKKPKAAKKIPSTKKPLAINAEALPDDVQGVIHVFTDGASSGNPGPSGAGVFFKYNGHEKKISRYLGQGTNNIAELEAIKTGLLEIKNKDLPVQLYTDSSYALGLLTKNWKPKKTKSHPNNQDRVSCN